MTTPEGQRQIRELARGADIVIENFKVGGLRKYGLDAHSLRAINPRLVYCSITGFGQTGPYAGRAGLDFLITDRKSGVLGKGVEVRVAAGGRSFIKKKKQEQYKS